MRGDIEYKTTDGKRSINRSALGFEATYRLGRPFVHAELAWERNPLEGFSHRLTQSAGLGASIFDTPTFTWKVNAGPGFRQFSEVNGAWIREVAAHVGTSIEWQLAERVKFNESAKSYVGSKTTTYEALSSLTTDLGGPTSLRLSFRWSYEKARAQVFSSTEAVSRASIVYAF